MLSTPRFYPLYKKSWLLNTLVKAVFKPEAELTLILRLRFKEIANK